jgi:NAD(P)-dependent dehydrogenase (short-subunit alcohol dehydrogenase family)
VVNLSSVARFTNGTTNAAYSASKGVIRPLTQKLARDLAPHGVRVNAVAPGYRNTPKPGKVGSNPQLDELINWHIAGLSGVLR